MPNTKTPQYELDYIEFLDTYASGEVDGGSVGIVIAKEAHYFAKYNLDVSKYDRRLSIVARDIESRTDENSGKPITSTKAKTFISATDEAHDLIKAKTHLQNIEQYINALKALQRGLNNEYSHMAKIN